MADSLEMYFYSRSGGAVKHTAATISSSTNAAIVTPTTGKRLVLLGFEVTLSTATVDLSYGVGTTAQKALFTDLLLGTILAPVVFDLRECPPIGAVNQLLLANVSSGSAKLSVYTMEMD